MCQFRFCICAIGLLRLLQNGERGELMSAFGLWLPIFCLRKGEKMTLNTFTDLLVDELNRRSDEETFIEHKSIRKNNGTQWEALIIRKGDSRIAPTIYLDDWYRKYRDGKEIFELAGNILGAYDKMLEKIDIGKGFFLSYEEVRNGLYMRLVNAEKNEEMLKEVPHRKWRDLALVCYYRMPRETLDYGTIQIHNFQLACWGVSPEQILEDAWQNTRREFQPRLRPVREVLFSIREEVPFAPVEDIPEMPLYVLTGKEQYMGAVCITLPGVAEDISEKMNGDFYVLPSSIHECLVVPDDGSFQFKTEELNAMVREINLTQLTPEEVLSEHVYHYSREKGRFDI